MFFSVAVLRERHAGQFLLIPRLRQRNIPILLKYLFLYVNSLFHV